MTTALDPATEVVQELIRSCRSTHEGFRCAARAVPDEETKRLFSIYAQQRTRFADELCQHLPPGIDGSWNLAASEVACDEMAANEILRQCLDAEKRSFALYSQALASREMPTRAHFLVSAQFSLLQRVHDRVGGMFATRNELQEERA